MTTLEEKTEELEEYLNDYLANYLEYPDNMPLAYKYDLAKRYGAEIPDDKKPWLYSEEEKIIEYN